MKKNIILKEKIVTDLQNLLNDFTVTGLINFSKITSIELKEIRQELTKSNIHVKSVKNTLIKKALKNIGNDTLIPQVSGQKLLIFGNEIKIFVTSMKSISKINNNFKINSIYLYNRIYYENNYFELSAIGNKNDQITNFLFVIKSPIIKFIKTLKYSYIKLLLVLKILELNIKGEKNVNQK